MIPQIRYPLNFTLRMNNPPLKPAGNGNRDKRGRFQSGNTAGKGNPLGKKVGQLRSALIGSVTDGDMKAIIKALVKKARGGDVAAAKIVLERTLGKPAEFDLLERLEAIEQFVERETKESANVH